MIGGLNKTTSRLALVAAAGFVMGGLALTPANAADLGGDCCADLEERVAELEATTVRKGNRKVSLTISGHVARVIGILDDANGDSELYSAGHGVSGSRVQFAGSAELVPGWTAGYTLRLRFNGDRTTDVLNEAGNAGAGTVSHDRNFVYLKSDRLGTFVIGEAAAPTDGIANISLGGRGVTGDSSGTDWNNVANMQGFDLEQGTHQAIAYISPTVYGFTFAAAWADLNDPSTGDAGVDAWDFALRYAREFGPMRFAAGLGYTVNDDSTGKNGEKVEGSNMMGSVALMHVPTGLNVAFAAGTEFDGGLLSHPNANLGDFDTGNDNDDADASFWHIEGGINRDFTGLGNTSIYGEYGQYDSGVANNDELHMWGLGVVQHFDKAATELFIAYRQWEDDDDSGTDDAVSQVMAGMRIKF